MAALPSSSQQLSPPVSAAAMEGCGSFLSAASASASSPLLYELRLHIPDWTEGATVQISFDEETVGLSSCWNVERPSFVDGTLRFSLGPLLSGDRKNLVRANRVASLRESRNHTPPHTRGGGAC